jgi:DNA transformation protein
MDRETIAEMFSAFGPVAAKRMFSGFGLWSEGVCFCLVLRGGEFYLKADVITIPQFEDNGCKPFSYTQRTSGKVVSVNSFWRMPERLYDDPDELAEWARAAVGAAHRAASIKVKRSRPNAASKIRTPSAATASAKTSSKTSSQASRKPSGTLKNASGSGVAGKGAKAARKTAKRSAAPAVRAKAKKRQQRNAVRTIR